jgi:hypothetical protein
MTIVLPSEIEERLIEESERRNLPASTLALELLDQHLPSKDRHDKLIKLIQSWIDSDDLEEQRETGDYLIKVLDEDRLSDRKLFPKELKGVTW